MDQTAQYRQSPTRYCFIASGAHFSSSFSEAHPILSSPLLPAQGSPHSSPVCLLLFSAPLPPSVSSTFTTHW